jgi:indole-3-glycerol phosphate synthase
LPYIPTDVVKISESGLHTAHDVLTLKNAGFQGFLMGENFMKQQNPGIACTEFAKQISSI